MKLFYCDAHDQDGESLALYIRASTHHEAARLMIDYWVAEERIEDADDIDEESIGVFEVPTIGGDSGVICWDAIEIKQVPNDTLF
jgi:hypothetical protein